VLSDRETTCQVCVTPNGFAPDRYVLDVGDTIGMSEGASDVNTLRADRDRGINQGGSERGIL
jgi:hypothetical protein